MASGKRVISKDKLSYERCTGEIDRWSYRKHEMRVWIGVQEGVCPSPPVNRRLTNTFATAPISGRCGDHWVFSYGGEWLLPIEEECFIEYNHDFTGHEAAFVKTRGKKWIPLRTHERYSGIRLVHRAEDDDLEPVGVLIGEPRQVDDKDEPEKAKSDQKQAQKRGRGRPKGSKDTKPRKRRSKTTRESDSRQISAIRTQDDVQSTALMPNEPENAPRGPKTGHERVPLGTYESTFISPMRRCLWIPMGDDEWLPMGIWEGYGRQYVISEGFFVPRPDGGIECDDGDVPRPVIEAGMRRIKREMAA